MNRNERYENNTLAILTAMEGHQKEVWTALPGIIQSFNPMAMTCTVKPAVLIPLKDPETADISQVEIPVLLDVPVIYPSGGGFTLTFPIKNGDECLVIFSSRCIDTWWQNGGYKNQLPLLRMNDLSDGFALIGPRSQVRTLPNVSSATTQLRSDDGACYVELENTHVVNIVAPGGINITGPVNITGALTATGEGTFNGHTVGNHRHSDPQGGTTGLPTG
jgi:phage baseplate assembly protein gpV